MCVFYVKKEEWKVKKIKMKLRLFLLICQILFPILILGGGIALGICGVSGWGWLIFLSLFGEYKYLKREVDRYLRDKQEVRERYNIEEIWDDGDNDFEKV